MDDSAATRGRVFGTEYLGTTQIVTVTTARGTVKARLPADLPVRVGEQVGLSFCADRISLFDAVSGRALRRPVSEGGPHG